MKGVYWSESGQHVAVVADESFYLLKFNADAVEAALAGEVIMFMQCGLAHLVDAYLDSL